ncbi:MAG: fibronectin type III domain-containing protein [Nitrospira sp.]|nr:fibronectin type III domain-containing protein [Nitrospira sp.]
MAQSQQAAQSRRTNHDSAIPWFRQVLLVTALICFGLVSEGLAQTTISPTSQTYYAVQGATNPPKQTITVSRTSSRTATLTASDNASWLTVSPAKTSMGKTAKLAVTVNTSGRGAGTYKATITIKVGTWYTKTVPVTLVISSATSSPPSSPPSTTSSATLTWNAVTGATVSGYKVYIGEAPRLYTRTINVGSVTSSTVNSLTVGRMYYFAVTAYNSAGESTPSNEVSKTIQ